MNEPTSPTTSAAIPDSDLSAHVEDDLLVGAYRNGKLVQVRWNELTPDERRAAYCNLHYIY